MHWTILVNDDIKSELRTKYAVGYFYGKPLVTVWRKDWVGYRGGDIYKKSILHKRWELHFNLFGCEKLTINENNHFANLKYQNTENNHFYDTEEMEDFNLVMKMGNQKIRRWVGRLRTGTLDKDVVTRIVETNQ